MGYCYEAYGSRRLVCDKCGHAGGVRKRTCPYKVAWHDGHALRYCPPPALCAPCYKEMGGLRGVHGEHCRQGAASSQVQQNVTKAKFVPEGMVGVLYKGRWPDGSANEAYYLVPKKAYESRPWFSEVSHIAESWENHPV